MTKKLPKLTTLRNKADKLFQQCGHLMYHECMVCAREYSCLHHVYTKGSSPSIRYDFDNGIPICNSCHTRHHLGQDPRVHAMILLKRGKKWFNDLTKKKVQYVKTDRAYYEKVIEELTNKLEELKKIC